MIDLQKARLSQDYSSISQVEKVHTVIPVARPPKTAFFRVNPDPDYNFESFLLEYQQNAYLVYPEVAYEFPELVKAVRLVSAVTREGNPYLWPLRLPKDDGRSDHWATSAIEISELAKTSWVRVNANMQAGFYIGYKAPGITIEPAFLSLSMDEQIQKAFHGRVIDSVDHTIAQEMLGGNTLG